MIKQPYAKGNVKSLNQTHYPSCCESIIASLIWWNRRRFDRSLFGEGFGWWNPAVEVCPSYWRGESVFACVVNWITLHQPVSAKWSGSGIFCSGKKKKRVFLCPYEYHVSQGSELVVVFLQTLGEWWTSVITGKFALFGRNSVLLNQVVSFCCMYEFFVLFVNACISKIVSRHIVIYRAPV